MIRVFVYVTGLALANFDGSVGPVTVLMPSGNHDYSFPQMPHRLTMTVATNESTNTEVPLPPGPFVLRLKAGDAAVIAKPQAIANLADLSGSSLKSECTDADPSTPCRTHRGEERLRAVTTFHGAWAVAPAADCRQGFSPPADTTKLPFFNFLRASEAWNTRYSSPPQLTNSMLFSIDVGSIGELEVLIGGTGYHPPVVTDSTSTGLCRSLGQSGMQPRCVIIALRNEVDPRGHAINYVGGGDLHFVPLFDLFESPPAREDLWLPTLVKGTVCPGGGGCCGQVRCIGGLVSR